MAWAFHKKGKDDSNRAIPIQDVCDNLGYTNHNKAMGDHCKGVTKRYPLLTSGGMQELRVLTEADVLRLVINSNMPAAEAFERWVFEEVLPSQSQQMIGSLFQQRAEPARDTAALVRTPLP